MTETTTVKSIPDVIEMFGKIDRQANGAISSEYPAWMNQVHVDNLKEDIRSTEQRLAMGAIPYDKTYQEKMKLDMLKEKLHKIEESKPHLNDKERDRCFKMYKHFGKEIASLLPTRTQDKKGLGSPHAELKIMQQPCIKVPTEFSDQVLALGIPILGGKISRNRAAKVWKILGSLIQEPTNVEYLRED